MYAEIESGKYGSKVFAGKHFNLFCGPPEDDTTCTGMDFTKTWLESQGGIVDLYLEDVALGHNGFQVPSSFKYKESMLKQYLLCYGGTTDLNYNSKTKASIYVYPNPSSDKINLRPSAGFQNATISLINSMGQVVRKQQHVNGLELTIPKENLLAGVYFVLVEQQGKIIYTSKLQFLL